MSRYGRVFLRAGFIAVSSLYLATTSVNARTNEVINGKVVGVHDGDTLTLLMPGKAQVKVRLNGIDAPEAGQAFGEKSKQALSAFVFGKSVRIIVTDTDRYGRTVCGKILLQNTACH